MIPGAIPFIAELLVSRNLAVSERRSLDKILFRHAVMACGGLKAEGDSRSVLTAARFLAARRRWVLTLTLLLIALTPTNLAVTV